VSFDKAAQFAMDFQRATVKLTQSFEPQKTFLVESWDRPGGGGGCTMVLEDGKVFERAAVNFSQVHGELSARMAAAIHVAPAPFRATGVSLILHPVNPFVPTIHLNFRYFELDGGKDWWIGGGTDVTPVYPNIEDAKLFHTSLKAALDPFGAELYGQFKKECDEYFYLPHRNETRGIGGVFFDYLRGDFPNRRNLWAAVGEAFHKSYFAIVEQRKNTVFGPNEIAFQRLRRGRYVEFNLLFDRGTKFGIESAGRTESVLASMPRFAEWRYNYAPPAGSKEALAIEMFKPTDWLGMADNDLLGSNAAPTSI